MKFTLKHGADLETATPAEVEAIIERSKNEERPIRVRAEAIIALDGTGGGQDEVYTVPVGWEFEARRVFLDLDGANDPLTGNRALNVAGQAVSYLRSGTRIEWANPVSPAGVASVPGIQTWGFQQGPYLANGETFEVRAVGLIANIGFKVTLEGILQRPNQRR